MIYVCLTDLVPRMVLAAPIPHPRTPDRALVKAGFVLTQDAIDKLPRYGVRGVWIRHPGFDFLDDKILSAIPEARIRLYHQVKKSFSQIAQRTSGAFNLSDYHGAVSQMILKLAAERKHAIWAQRLLNDPDDLFGHSANVAYLSLTIGLRINQYVQDQRRYVSGDLASDLTNLGIGAMLHDIGKLRMEPVFRQAHCMFEPQDGETYREHTRLGYRGLRGRIDPTAVGIVLHHHQRFDGKGFPEPDNKYTERQLEPLQGERIHIFARIVAVANVLDGLIKHFEDRKIPLVAALSALISPQCEGMFDPILLGALLRSVPPFPVGTCVRLSDGREAVVVDWNENCPCEPRVQVLNQADPIEESPGEQINLARAGAPRIVAQHNQRIDKYLYRIPPNDHAAVRDPSSSASSK